MDVFPIARRIAEKYVKLAEKRPGETYSTAYVPTVFITYRDGAYYVSASLIGTWHEFYNPKEAASKFLEILLRDMMEMYVSGTDMEKLIYNGVTELYRLKQLHLEAGAK